ncbi:DUF1679 domain-containing protein [Crocinitomicaceae bacterium]|nr:DUF1679 domain-containing protein [Crocinitomicaceae bacterium]
MNHPRGWDTDVSSQRKLKSYEVERCWYQNYVPSLPEEVKVPELMGYYENEGDTTLVMEDLKGSGFIHDFCASSEDSFQSCLEWLASFHAFHMGMEPKGLWDIGTYWHLDTRQEELKVMSECVLRDQAKKIDKTLNSCKYKTLVHGDAKPANFLFNSEGQAAAVDFQYVGGGCGMKDLVYLMSSALDEEDLFKRDSEIIERYFELLKSAMDVYDVRYVDFGQLKEEWTSMYKYAWLDFVRFLEGWSPGHSRLNSYTKQLMFSPM